MLSTRRSDGFGLRYRPSLSARKHAVEISFSGRNSVR